MCKRSSQFSANTVINTNTIINTNTNTITNTIINMITNTITVVETSESKPANVWASG